MLVDVSEIKLKQSIHRGSLHWVSRIQAVVRSVLVHQVLHDRTTKQVQVIKYNLFFYYFVSY